MAGGGATVEMPRRPLGSLAPFSLDKSGRIKVSRVEEGANRGTIDPRFVAMMEDRRL